MLKVACIVCLVVDIMSLKPGFFKNRLPGGVVHFIVLDVTISPCCKLFFWLSTRDVRHTQVVEWFSWRGWSFLVSCRVNDVRRAHHIVAHTSHPRWLFDSTTINFLLTLWHHDLIDFLRHGWWHLRRMKSFIFGLFLVCPLIVYLLLVALHVLHDLLAGPERLCLPMMRFNIITLDQLLAKQG